MGGLIAGRIPLSCLDSVTVMAKRQSWLQYRQRIQTVSAPPRIVVLIEVGRPAAVLQVGHSIGKC
jgi:hypothetical protein